MQKNSSKDLSWVKNIGWKSLQVSLAGGKRREMREEVCKAQGGDRHVCVLQREAQAVVRKKKAFGKMT